MPRYDFRCHDCATVFEERRRMARANAPATCPQCGSENTYKLLSQVAIVGSGTSASGEMPAAGGGCGCGASCACGHH
jgi:putative FmdB family regulatory protein